MNTSLLASIERESLSDRIAAKLRLSIISGVFPPGTHLPEIELAQHLKVSRGALREGLRTLQGEGLVTAFPNRGVFVTQIQEQDIEEIYSLRELLETFAVRLVIEHVTPEQVEQLQMLVDQMVGAAQSADPSQVVELDLQFHQTLWRISGHQRLLQLLTSLLSQIKTFLALNTELYEDLVDGIADHQKIVDAIRAKKVEKAERQMRHHIALATGVVLPHIRQMKRKTHGKTVKVDGNPAERK